MLLIVCGVSALVLVLVVSLVLKWKVSRQNGNASTLISKQILFDVNKDGYRKGLSCLTVKENPVFAIPCTQRDSKT